MKYKAGDKVIVNPDTKTDAVHHYSSGYFTFREYMHKPGVIRITEVREDYYYCSDDYSYAEEWLLPAPMYKVGDKVKIVLELPDDMHYGIATEMKKYCYSVVTISKVEVEDYKPGELGEDGCLYRIEEDNEEYSWPSTAFIINIKKQLRDEDQLQEKRVTVSRGDQYTGCSICCRRRKASITVGHLSNKEIIGN